MLKKIIATGVFVIDAEGKLLCLHRKMGFREGGKFGIPGGVVRKGRGILGSAVYKLENEVGLICKKDELIKLGKFEYVAEEVNIVFHLFILKLNTACKDVILAINEEGHDQYIWDAPEDLLKRGDLMVGMYTLLPAYINQL